MPNRVPAPRSALPAALSLSRAALGPARPAPLGAHSDPKARLRARSPHKVCAALLLPPAGLSPRRPQRLGRPRRHLRGSPPPRARPRSRRRPPAPPSPAPSRPPALPGPVPTDLRPRAAAGRRRAAGSAGTRGPGGERVARGRPIPRSRQLGSSGAARQKGARGRCRARSRAPHVACRPAAGKRRGQRTAGGRECSGCGVNAAEMPAGRNGRTNTRIAYIFPFAPGGGARRKGRTEGPQPSEQPWRAQHRGSPQAAAAGAHGADSSRRYSAPGPAAFPSEASRATSARSARALPCPAAPQTRWAFKSPDLGEPGGPGCCANVTWAQNNDISQTEKSLYWKGRHSHRHS